MPKIVFDTDGTIITTDPYPGGPVGREDVLALLRAFNKLGWDIYVHSGGGVLYAERWVRYLKLDEEMHIFISIKGDSKIHFDIAVDDCDLEKEWSKDKTGNYIDADLFIKV